MVVDDDDDIRGSLDDLLTDHGYAVCCARSGEDAIEQLSAGAAPELILIDLQMPGMGGIAFSAACKELAVQRVILSGSPISREERDGCGATESLRKPVDAEALLTLVDRLLA